MSLYIWCQNSSEFWSWIWPQTRTEAQLKNGTKNRLCSLMSTDFISHYSVTRYKTGQELLAMVSKRREGFRGSWDKRGRKESWQVRPQLVGGRNGFVIFVPNRMCGRGGAAGDATTTSQPVCVRSTGRRSQQGLETGQRALRLRAGRRIESPNKERSRERKERPCGEWMLRMRPRVEKSWTSKVTSERPIALMPTLILWWEALRAPEVVKWHQKYRVDWDATDGRNGGPSKRCGKFCWRRKKSIGKQREKIKGLWPWAWTWRRPSSESVCSVGLGDALQLPEEDTAGAMRVLRAPEVSAVRRMRGGAAPDHHGFFARVQVELLASSTYCGGGCTE